MATCALGVDYDDLSGATKTAKIIALISYLKHRDRIAELIRLVQWQRQDIDVQDDQSLQQQSAVNSATADDRIHHMPSSISDRELTCRLIVVGICANILYMFISSE